MIGLVVLTLLIPRILLLHVIHFVPMILLMPVILFGLEILIAPTGKNPHQAVSLDQLEYFQQQLQCYPYPLKYSPPIPIDLHIFLFYGFGGECREPSCFSIFYC